MGSSQKEKLTDELRTAKLALREQQLWVEQHGGTRLGYAKNYARSDVDSNKLYEADVGELDILYGRVMAIRAELSLYD